MPSFDSELPSPPLFWKRSPRTGVLNLADSMNPSGNLVKPTDPFSECFDMHKVKYTGL